MTDQPITASMLYNYTQCPTRVYKDLFSDPADRDPVSPFIQMLWDRGNAYEQEVIEKLDVPFTNLKDLPPAEREQQTLEAMDRGEDLICGGRIRSGDLLGDPDLLKRVGNGYIAGDIKSGRGKAGGNGYSSGKLKVHYAVQVAHYQNILEQLDRSGGRIPFILDVNGDEVPYSLDEKMGQRSPTPWEKYQECLSEVIRIAERNDKPLPALSAGCGLCHWQSSCRRQLEASDDLTLIPELGRARRDVMVPTISTVTQLAETNIEQFCTGKKTAFRGVGTGSLEKFKLRAKLLSNPGAKPVVTQSFEINRAERELFFDVETDPFRDICYLHGFWETGTDDAGRFVHFFADAATQEAEEEVFRGAWNYIQDSMPCKIYVYSPYERTTLKKLAEKYPEVANVDEVEDLFGEHVTDLLAVVRNIEFPTNNKSVKTLAKFFGFEWRDEDPSGAASIEWFSRFLESGDEGLRERFLQYNEDDCRAMLVLLGGIEVLR